MFLLNSRQEIFRCGPAVHSVFKQTIFYSLLEPTPVTAMLFEFCLSNVSIILAAIRFSVDQYPLTTLALCRSLFVSIVLVDSSFEIIGLSNVYLFSYRMLNNIN